MTDTLSVFPLVLSLRSSPSRDPLCVTCVSKFRLLHRIDWSHVQCVTCCHCPCDNQGPKTLPFGIRGLFYFEGLHLTLTMKSADFTLERLGVHKPSSHEVCHVRRCLI